MKEVGVLEAKTGLSALLDEVSAGEEVVITRHGRPIARLTPYGRAKARAGDFATRTLALRDAIACEDPSEEPFDWKAAVEEGRP